MCHFRLWGAGTLGNNRKDRSKCTHQLPMIRAGSKQHRTRRQSKHQRTLRRQCATLYRPDSHTTYPHQPHSQHMLRININRPLDTTHSQHTLEPIKHIQPAVRESTHHFTRHNSPPHPLTPHSDTTACAAAFACLSASSHWTDCRTASATI